MDLNRMAFEFIEKLIREGKHKEAAVNLWHIAKNNRMRKLTKSLAENYHDAIELDIYQNSGAVDEMLLKSESYLLADELKKGLKEVRGKKDLDIPFTKTMKFGYKFDEEKLSKKDRTMLFNRIAKIKELGFEVVINEAS